MERSCDVIVAGAGLAGLAAALHLRTGGADVVVLEAQDRVGGRTRTEDLGGGAFVDHGGQWVSPGQDRIVALAAELGVEPFPSWDAGSTVRWQDGVRSIHDGALPPDPAVRDGARRLVELAAELPEDAPWRAPHAAAWDAQTFRGALEELLGDPGVADTLDRSLQGVFGGGPGETSLLAALAIIRSGAHEITRLVASEELGPERRFAGGAQQLCERIAERLGDRVVLGAHVGQLAHGDGVRATCLDGRSVRARRALVTLPPALAGRIHYDPALPAARDHLTQRTPMGWIIKVHGVYPERFWADDGLSGKVVSDEGAVRAVADNSPPSGSPGILVGFVEGEQARHLAPATPAERRDAFVSDLVRYFGDAAARPLSYHEWSWGDDAFTRGAYGGFWTPGVWTTYGHALRAPIGPIHWAGTETSTAWNAKLEGAVHSGETTAREILDRL